LIHSIAQVQPRTIVVIVAGSAVIMSEWINEVPAVLMGWYSGSNGGRALANVLSGAVNPSGRLPFVIPYDESHLPFFDRNAKAITYDYWHGQWKLDRDGNKAMFPFGFGCSYTTFSYSDVIVDIEEVVKVRCVVRNTGTQNGATVVQVYVSRNDSTVERPLRRLIAFKRVDVAAGETVQVECEVPFERFATRDVRSHSWFVEGGIWNCEVGQFSGDSQSLSASFHVPERIEL
jgi:beta-glucosidase